MADGNESESTLDESGSWGSEASEDDEGEFVPLGEALKKEKDESEEEEEHAEELEEASDAALGASNPQNGSHSKEEDEANEKNQKNGYEENAIVTEQMAAAPLAAVARVLPDIAALQIQEERDGSDTDSDLLSDDESESESEDDAMMVTTWTQTRDSLALTRKSTAIRNKATKKFARSKTTTYLDMVLQCIREYGQRDGCTVQFIKKFVTDRVGIDSWSPQATVNLKRALNQGVEGDLIVQTKGRGMNGSFGINNIKKSKSKAKPKEAVANSKKTVPTKKEASSRVPPPVESKKKTAPKPKDVAPPPTKGNKKKKEEEPMPLPPRRGRNANATLPIAEVTKQSRSKKSPEPPAKLQKTALPPKVTLNVPTKAKTTKKPLPAPINERTPSPPPAKRQPAEATTLSATVPSVPSKGAAPKKNKSPAKTTTTAAPPLPEATRTTRSNNANKERKPATSAKNK